MIIDLIKRIFNKKMTIKTKHGNIQCPNFFPIIGWPAGRGEYDRLFESLKYFSDKLKHNHFLFNFSSFAFGFVIPKNDFNNIFDSFKTQDLRDSLTKFTKIDKEIAKKLIILLDIGGNRIFNKLVFDNEDISKYESYEKYLNAYFDFISTANVDIYVSFDVGPSYSTRDEISKKGVKIWTQMSQQTKNDLNKKLLDESVKRKVKNSLVMVPIGGGNIESLKSHLSYLYENYKNKIDILAIGGIANQGIEKTEKVLKIVRNFLDNKKWNVKVHGLGMGGWKNIPLLIKYRIDTCDVATPWRRSCTDSISNFYIPLFDKELNIIPNKKAFQYFDIYNAELDNIECNCPFCQDMSFKELRKIYKKADKGKNGKSQHDNEYYKMRVRVFYHNVFQHIALLNKLFEYKKKYGDNFLRKFSDELPEGKVKNYFEKLV